MTITWFFTNTLSCPPIVLVDDFAGFTKDYLTFSCRELSSNSFKYVPQTVRSSVNMTSLTQLFLGSNHLTFLEADTFTNASLTILYAYMHALLSGGINLRNEIFIFQIHEVIKYDPSHCQFS